jgi:hypothetical protein
MEKKSRVATLFQFPRISFRMQNRRQTEHSEIYVCRQFLRSLQGTADTIFQNSLESSCFQLTDHSRALILFPRHMIHAIGKASKISEISFLPL